MGYDFLEAPDHVLGVNAASRPDWDLGFAQRVRRICSTIRSCCSASLQAAPASLASPLACSSCHSGRPCWWRSRRRALAVLCGGAFPSRHRRRLERGGIPRPQRELLRNRGRRSEEQVQVMQALWAEEFMSRSRGAITRSTMQGSTRGRRQVACRCRSASPG